MVSIIRELSGLLSVQTPDRVTRRGGCAEFAGNGDAQMLPARVDWQYEPEAADSDGRRESPNRGGKGQRRGAKW
jgi:hypothetical protein